MDWRAPRIVEAFGEGEDRLAAVNLITVIYLVGAGLAGQHDDEWPDKRCCLGLDPRPNRLTKINNGTPEHTEVTITAITA